MNKVEQIRKEIERRHKWYKDELEKYSHPSLVVDLAAKAEETESILSFIDSLQDKCDGCNNVKGCVTCSNGSEWAHYEEPVSIDFEQELYRAFGQVKDFTFGMRIAKWFYDMGKNSQEPVSEDLEEAANAYIYNESNWIHPRTETFKAGAKWGMEQAKVEIQAQSMALAHGCPKESVTEDLEFASEKYACRFTSSKYGHDKIKATFKEGAQWQKQQMMKDALEVEYWDGSFFRNDLREFFKDGDKVKIIIVKDE